MTFITKDYLPDKWRRILRHNNLDSFERLWDHQSDWYEEPNERRGGWSGVSRCELELPEGGEVTIYRKTQENHTSRSLRKPFGMLTFTREFNAMMHFRKAGLPSVKPVYFAVRKIEGNMRAILCVEALDDYISLKDLVKSWRRKGRPEKATRLRVMRAVADFMRRMHERRIQHHQFLPKHIFLRFEESGAISVRVIDLEEASIQSILGMLTFRDLYTLNRASRGWSRTDRLRFFLIYFDRERLDPAAKAIWRKIQIRNSKRSNWWIRKFFWFCRTV